MHESDTYLAIVDEGREKQAKEDILGIGEERLGPLDELAKIELKKITDLKRLRRMHRRAVKATHWREILDAP